MPHHSSARTPTPYRMVVLPLLLACAGALCLSACTSAGSGSAQVTTGGTASTAPADGTQGVRTLVGLAAQRIMTADTVAAAKWGTSRPIDDPAREKVVLDGALAQAAKRGVNPLVARRVFEGQIAASKVVQHALYAQWTASPALRPTHRPDLATQVRPVLDRIDGQLLDAIKQAQPLLSGAPGCAALMDREISDTARTMRLDTVHREALRQSLTGACRAA